MHRDDNKSMSARLAGLEDVLHAAAREATPSIYSAVKRYLTPKGAVSPQVGVSIPTGNTVDGEYEVEVSTTTAYGKLDYAFRVPMKAGAPVIAETNFIEAFDKAFQAQKDAPVDLGTARPEYEVDLKTIEAERQHDLVVYSSKALPEWSFIATVDQLKDTKSHAVIASQIVAAVRGHILATLGAVAKFGETSFSLPPVRATEVKAAAKAVELTDIPGFNTPKTAHEIYAEVLERNMIVNGSKAAQAPSELQAADEEAMRFQAYVSRQAIPVVERYVKATLKGDAPQVIATDFSELRRRANGFASGKFLVAVRFHGSQGIEETEIEVPFENDRVVADKLAKTAKSIKAAEAREAELKVLSAEEAKARFEDFKARQAAHAEDLLAIGLSVSAGDSGMGNNFMKRGVSERIPVLKALMPADVKPGGKVLVGSYVYTVAETDYQSVSAEKSAFYMLCLTDDIPGKDMPTLGVWGSLGGFA